VSGVFRVGEDAYDDFMGRYSKRLAPLFADFVGVAGGDHVLDVGAGTGALAEALLERGCHVAVAEPSPEFSDALRRRFPQLDVREAPAEELPFPDGAFDAALAQLVVAFVADAPRAVAEMARVARVVAVCMWGVQEVEMFAAIDRTADAVGATRGAEPRRYRTPQELHDLLAPLGEVESAELDVAADYTGFDDFWHALEAQVGPAGAWLASLDSDRREAAREELFRQFGSPSGPFQLQARAFAAAVRRG
jgi:SAM-dependent methyltransferase